MIDVPYLLDKIQLYLTQGTEQMRQDQFFLENRPGLLAIDFKLSDE